MKICSRCGKQIDDRVIYCPFCGEKQDSHTVRVHEEVVRKKSSENNSPVFGKKILIAVVICVLIAVGIVTVFISFQEDGNSAVRENAEKIVAAFEQKDMQSVSKIIFGFDNLDADDYVSDLFIEKDSENGILANIFSMDTLRVDKISGTEIIYRVEAPDMSGFFDSLFDKTDNLTEEDLRQYIEQYLEETEKIISDVPVSYEIENGEFHVNYRTEEFVNALTGGLLEAYRDLYQEMLDEYKSDLGN